MFILGIIVGFLMCLTIILGSLISHRKGANFNDRLNKVVDRVVPKEKGQTFKPLGLEEQRVERIISKNNKVGRDTPLSEIM